MEAGVLSLLRLRCWPGLPPPSDFLPVVARQPQPALGLWVVLRIDSREGKPFSLQKRQTCGFSLLSEVNRAGQTSNDLMFLRSPGGSH